MRVLILGGGYAGLLVARKLETRLPSDVDLTLVDETGDHLVQHELHRVVRRPDVAADLSIPLGELLERASVREGRVVEVDRAERAVGLADGEELSYDVAAVCLGAQTDYHGLPGVEAHARPLKGLADAAAVRREFEELLATGGTAVVGGAGLSGIQVAGELAAYAREERADVRVVLLEQEDGVAPSFPANFRRAVRRELDDCGVVVRTGTTVERATEATVATVDGDAIPYDQFVWTGGIRGPDALGGERPRVRSTLQLDERTFVLGDAARVVDAEGRAVPASAQAAVRAAETGATNVCRVVADHHDGFRPRLEQWRFEPAGWLVSVGDGAVAQLGSRVLTGPLADLVKSSVGVTYLAEHGSLRRALRVVDDDLDVRGGLLRGLLD